MKNYEEQNSPYIYECVTDFVSHLESVKEVEELKKQGLYDAQKYQILYSECLILN